MFFFFPFYTESQPFSNGSSSSHAKALPFLPASGSARTNSRATKSPWDFGDFGVDFLRQTIEALTASLTALGNAANALFAQATAALAANCAAGDTASLFNTPWFGFGMAPKARPAASFGFSRLSPIQDPMSFSPLLTQGFNPWGFNPWAAFAEGLNFWTSLWMPAAPQRNPYSFGNNTPAAPFMAKVSTPNGFSWGFSWGV